MLIGFDMLAVQAASGGNRAAARYGRHLVASILARNTGDDFLLYVHEGLPTAAIPAAAARVSRQVLAPIATTGAARLRPTIQRLVDQNPDGLDWLVLLDPFAVEYGDEPPEGPVGSLKLASVVLDLGAIKEADLALSPLRWHDAIFAVSATTAARCRSRLGIASSRVAALNGAAGPEFTPADRRQPLGKVAAEDLGRLGIFGPFLFHHVGDNAPAASLEPVLASFAHLPVEHRQHLVIAGSIPDEAAARSSIHRRGIEARVLLLGPVSEPDLARLYRRCSAYLGSMGADDPALILVEAVRSGAPVLTTRTEVATEILGDAGFLVDPLDPREAAVALAALLRHEDLDRDLRARSIARSELFGWETAAATVEAVLIAGSVPALAANLGPPVGSSRLRFDTGHAVRPRIASFPVGITDPAALTHLAAQLVERWAGRYNIDFYLEPEQRALADLLPIAAGGFDARLFPRNDNLLDYHAVVYLVADADLLGRVQPRIAQRPGLVVLDDGLFLDPLDRDSPRATEVIGTVNDLLATGSTLGVRSPRQFDLLHSSLSIRAGSVVLLPLDAEPEPIAPADRAEARARLDLWSDPLVIGQFVGPDTGFAGLLTPKALQSLQRTNPNVIIVTFGLSDGGEHSRLVRQARRLGLGNQYLLAPAVDADQVAGVVALLDLAIHPGGGATAGVSILDLLRGAIPTVAIGAECPADPVRWVPRSGRDQPLEDQIRDLVLRPEVRATLGRSGRDHVRGVADPIAAAVLLIEQLERCARDLPRASGRPPAGPARRGPRTSAFTPHFSRPSSATATATNEAAPGRGDS